MKIGADASAGYSLTVLPNPVRDHGTVSYRLPAGETGTVGAYDADGARVLELSVVTGTGVLALPVSDLASGSYTLRLETATGVQVAEKLTVRK